MAARKTTQAEKDRLTDDNLKTVLENQNSEAPWTKKAMCEFLGIAYNTSRLSSLLDKYKERVAYVAKRKSDNGGKPASEGEVISAIQSYIEGESIETIAKGLFRGSTFVKNILLLNGITFRPVSHNYFKPEIIPDEAVSASFEIGEIAYSTQYAQNVEIRDELPDTPTSMGSKVYRVWVMGANCRFAYLAAHELASLRHITALGVRI